MLVSAPKKSTSDVVTSVITAIESNEGSKAVEIVRQYSRQIDANNGIKIIELCIPKSMLTVIAMTIGELKSKIPPQQAGLFLEKAASFANEAVIKCLLTKARAGQLTIPAESFVQAQINVLNAFNKAAMISPEIKLQQLKQFLENPDSTYFCFLPNELKAHLSAFVSNNDVLSFQRFANIHNLIGGAYILYTDEVSADTFAKLEKMNTLTEQYNSTRNQQRLASKSASSGPEIHCKNSLVRVL